VTDSAVPRSGWVRAVREALGMSAAQLAARLGVTKQTVRDLEDAEVDRRATLHSLDRAARAMGCRLVYFVVPETTLEAQVDARARAVATRQLARVRHSMALESQEPTRQLHELQIEELAQELKAKRSHELWDET
jgi:predicted DNA-binding mobile mystery protein A